MRSSFLPVVVLAVLMAVPAGAQPTDDAQATPKPAESPRAATAVEPEPPKGVPPRTNVQIELTISDQTGSGPVEKKTVSMIAASGTWGRIRAAGVARPNSTTGNVPVGLNVDARPFLVGGLVHVELTIVYNPLSAQSIEAYDPEKRAGGLPSQIRPTELNQSLTVVLQNGKPLIVSQAADPVSDRKVVVEVKASILK
jgi:hypothetical protein